LGYFPPFLFPSGCRDGVYIYVGFFNERK